VGAGGEMTQALYAHMNNKRKKKKKQEKKKKKKKKEIKKNNKVLTKLNSKTPSITNF
jgi:hypothetical protein